MVLNGIAIAVVIVALLLLRRHGLLSAMGYPKLFLLSGLLVAVLAILFCGKASDFMAIDRCLDQGGRWNYEIKECEGAALITVSLENRSGQVIRSIVAAYTGGVANLGPLGVNESQEVAIRPTGESHLELEIQPANGQTLHRTVDTYFERGYRGKIRITLDSNFAVRLSTTLAP